MSKTLIFGHKNPDTDSIISSLVMADLQTKLGHDVEPVRLGEFGKETQYILDHFQLEAPRLIANLDGVETVMLVDHNEFGQSADGIENVRILAVVDHHRMANFQTSEPLMYRAEPVGCTSTILYKLYRENNIEITPTIAGLMASAIVSDTLLFKSPTCTPQDEAAAKELATIANLDLAVYGLEMLKAGTDLSDYSAEQLLSIDAKPFEMNGIKMEIAQVNTASIPEMMERQAEIEAAMATIIAERNLDLFFLAITDIINSNSQVIALGTATGLVEKAYEVKLANNTVLLPGVVSRKKQIVPVLQNNA